VLNYMFVRKFNVTIYGSDERLYSSTMLYIIAFEYNLVN